MNPQRSLTLAGVAMILGGMIVAVGVRLEWASVALSSSRVEAPDLPRVVLAAGSVGYTGSEIGAGYLVGFGLLLALVPLGWLVTGPRGRVALALVGVALAAVTVAGVAVARNDLSVRTLRLVRESSGLGFGGRISSGPGIPVAMSGAAIAGLGAIFGGIAGRAVPRMRMPERPDQGPPE